MTPIAVALLAFGFCNAYIDRTLAQGNEKGPFLHWALKYEGTSSCVVFIVVSEIPIPREIEYGPSVGPDHKRLKATMITPVLYRYREAQILVERHIDYINAPYRCKVKVSIKEDSKSNPERIFSYANFRKHFSGIQAAEEPSFNGIAKTDPLYMKKIDRELNGIHGAAAVF